MRRNTAMRTMLIMLAMAALGAGMAMAAEEAVSVDEHHDYSLGSGLRAAGIALAAALAISLTGFATARVQSAVGAGGTGLLAEKPDLVAYVLILFAIPETIVVLGFVVAILLWQVI